MKIAIVSTTSVRMPKPFSDLLYALQAHNSQVLDSLANVNISSNCSRVSTLDIEDNFYIHRCISLSIGYAVLSTTTM